MEHETISFDSFALGTYTGTEIRAERAVLLGGGIGGELRALLQQRGALVFRDLPLSDSELVAFAGTLGQVRSRSGDRYYEGAIFKLTYDQRENPRSSFYMDGTFYWHIDGTWEDTPPFASLLTPRILAPKGGATEFANCYAAYEALPETEKRELDGLMVIHSFAANYRDAVPDPSPAILAEWGSFANKLHPLVWTHRTGRKSLVLSQSAVGISGMEAVAGRALLDRLVEWSTRPEFVYRHEWQMDDVVMWDNTGTMHRVEPYDKDCGRKLHRVVLAGDEPFAP